jgi:hypothetical protein
MIDEIGCIDVAQDVVQFLNFCSQTGIKKHHLLFIGRYAQWPYWHISNQNFKSSVFWENFLTYFWQYWAT